MSQYTKDHEKDAQMFYRIPKCLITDPAYRAVSAEAKLLYGLLQDRQSLSVRNGWQDEQGRAYLYYAVAAIRHDLCCCKEKACKLLQELETAGLIERRQQGRGRPDRIYLRNPDAGDKGVERSDNPTASEANRSEKPTTGDTKRSEKQIIGDTKRSEKLTTCGLKIVPEKSEIPTASGLKIIPQEVGKTDPNKTEVNKTEFNKIHLSSSPTIEDEIREQLEYEMLQNRYPADTLDCRVRLIANAERSTAPMLRIGKEDVPRTAALGRFRELDRFHIEYIFDCLEESRPDIRNIRGYLLTALYRAPETMESYYAAKVARDEREPVYHARAA